MCQTSFHDFLYAPHPPVNGTTGEGLSLSISERRRVAEEWVTKGRNKLDQVVIHVGALSLKESQELAQHAAEIGADGIAVIAPFFLKPQNKDDLTAFLKEVAAAAPALPFYYYHIPALTGVKIRAEELLDGIQEKIPTFQGLKFSDTDLLDFGQCVDQNRERQFAFLFGVDEQLLSALVMGATGAVGSTYNYLGKKTNQMLEAYERKDFSSALNYQNSRFLGKGPHAIPLRTLQLKSSEAVKLVTLNGET
ncbi:N-acetylneuraminate lyase [Myotis davidii]|uniref:N-acetylneuraminate lyase n=1 Tax=Myotis davidii TaxID=225400 RepID=L5MET8_MYODS|nr:N-acetylneuraminate lyase [Myotis davidii]